MFLARIAANVSKLVLLSVSGEYERVETSGPVVEG